MTASRIYNFNAGPAALPLSVLEEIQDAFLNFKGSGMSIMEVSHRSKWFDDVINDAAITQGIAGQIDREVCIMFVKVGIPADK